MRVISGKYRGLKLAEFKGENIRPTADRVKESLFNILSQRATFSRVLDLFCGSGSLGIECLSRGAEEVIFNDISSDSLSVLNKNLARLAEKNYFVYNLDFKTCLNRLTGKFSLVFLDPPYRAEAGKEALEMISSRSLLSPDGIAVLERDRSFLYGVEGLELYDERKYGKTYLSFFKVRQ